jgi:hypothetical protein
MRADECGISVCSLNWSLHGGGFFVFTDSQNRPHTHRCHPLDQRPFSSRASLALSSPPRARTLRTLLGYQLPPRTVAAPRELSVSIRGAILLAVAAAIYGASALLSRQPDQQPAREQLYSHYAIDSRDGKLVIPSQVALTPI